MPQITISLDLHIHLGVRDIGYSHLYQSMATQTVLLSALDIFLGLQLTTTKQLKYAREKYHKKWMLSCCFERTSEV